MTVHFQDYVRSRYSIRTSLIDPEFEKQLAWKKPGMMPIR